MGPPHHSNISFDDMDPCYGKYLSLLYGSLMKIKVHVYLWADVLGNHRFSTSRFTTNRRDAILGEQAKISILLKQILRKRVPGLAMEAIEVAYVALHHFMHTNPNLPFLI
jgi:hypothetical protein